ncbi:CDP-diacylglycerol--glycerol-3-phosphate 3-phosphatidyltransferase, partial [Dietzia sp. DQ12-76]
MTLPFTDDGRPGAEVPLLNIANVLTVLRILLVPVFVVLFFVSDAQDPWWRVGAFVVFALAMATDYVDGYLARRLGLVTDFGKIADPIADKALMAAAMISLSLVDELFWWVTIVILVREVGITLWRLFGVDHVVAASKGGKLKTVTQT